MDSIKVKIKNFQSISDLEFEIKGFTTITGRTNIGKSAIIRAISGSILNIPVTNLVRKGKKYCTVELTSDQWSYKWEKGEKGVNRYWFPNLEAPLDKVGQGQISQIAEIGFKSIKIGSEYINPWYASQFEPIFLINCSGSSVTEFISEVSRLKVLQTAISISVNTKQQKLKEVKIRRDSIEKLEKKENLLNPIDSVLPLQTELEEQLASIEEYGETVLQLEEWYSQIIVLNDQINKLQVSLKIPNFPSLDLNKLKKMIEYNQKLENYAQSIIKLKKIKDVDLPDTIPAKEIDYLSILKKIINIIALEDSIKLLSIPISVSTDQINTDRLQRLTDLNNKIEKLEQQVILLDHYLSIPNSIEIDMKLEKLIKWEKGIIGLQKEIKSYGSQSNILIDQVNMINKELEQIPVCPTCGVPQVECDHLESV
jgi:hypothetical protein